MTNIHIRTKHRDTLIDMINQVIDIANVQGKGDSLSVGGIDYRVKNGLLELQKKSVILQELHEKIYDIEEK